MDKFQQRVLQIIYSKKNSTFVHHKSSLLIHLSNAEFGLSYTAGEKYFELADSGALQLSPELYFVSTKCQTRLIPVAQLPKIHINL